ncbi:MAG: 16S rRNA (guanine(966)-N(2))-methyltransferase RsmD [Kiritimatiellae bacterium]|nr:16S rRNA (guanine(966)-N(2))-methyltransferase RsmD [Kiritimatiellia bacterium]
MRISGGTLRGRTVKVPDTDLVRPTQDRVREALFSMLQAVVPGARVLDLFAGSGSLGIEALSRGAKSAVFVEQNPKHARILSNNLKTLGLSARVVVADAFKFSGNGETFDLVFADPPYALAEERGLEELMATMPLEPGGIFVAETGAAPSILPSPFSLLKEREYGKTKITIWRKPE